MSEGLAGVIVWKLAQRESITMTASEGGSW